MRQWSRCCKRPEAGCASQSTTGLGLLAPAGTPASLVEQIACDGRTVLDDEAVPARFIALGGLLHASSTAEFTGLIADDRKRCGEIIRSRRITVD